MIQLGDAGDYVRAWQRIVGVPASKVDGKFGPDTDALVKRWQAAHDVEPDGVIGPLTRAAVTPGALIKAYEGLRLQTYDDKDGKPLRLVASVWRRPDGAVVLGYPTIGWGRRLWTGQDIETCTREQADKWFDQDLALVRLPAVRRAFSEAKMSPDAAQFAAVTTFAYNAGTGASALGKLAASRFSREQWLSYNHTLGVVSVGLTMRRAEEFALFDAA